MNARPTRQLSLRPGAIGASKPDLHGRPPPHPEERGLRRLPARVALDLKWDRIRRRGPARLHLLYGPTAHLAPSCFPALRGRNYARRRVPAAKGNALTIICWDRRLVASCWSAKFSHARRDLFHALLVVVPGVVSREPQVVNRQKKKSRLSADFCVVAPGGTRTRRPWFD